MMTESQLAAILTTLRSRSDAAAQRQQNSFINSRLISSEVGLNALAVRRVLDQGVKAGVLERQAGRYNRGYSYRVVSG